MERPWFRPTGVLSRPPLFRGIAYAALGLTAFWVLIRVAFGPFQLGTLKRDELSRIPAKVVHEQLGAPPTGDGQREKARRNAHRRR